MNQSEIEFKQHFERTMKTNYNNFKQDNPKFCEQILIPLINRHDESIKLLSEVENRCVKQSLMGCVVIDGEPTYDHRTMFGRIVSFLNRKP